eukprot:CAMPEP_0115136714 /NCGR_PEP_ID=MMETSP0227-20121206/56545_1 /TAXON_ID=89957 /ORGANISM="Polarella glacialis, Strain CCMP 1383" /LENGTH=130 /DNA_ID=CAMNT_0002543815 /DNA_START=54 /DNA_END=443 /DNA_ORIENTATION=-
MPVDGSTGMHQGYGLLTFSTASVLRSFVAAFHGRSVRGSCDKFQVARATADDIGMVHMHEVSNRVMSAKSQNAALKACNFCPFCGARAQAGHKFCTECGGGLGSTGRVPPSSRPQVFAQQSWDSAWQTPW